MSERINVGDLIIDGAGRVAHIVGSAGQEFADTLCGKEFWVMDLNLGRSIKGRSIKKAKPRSSICRQCLKSAIAIAAGVEGNKVVSPKKVVSSKKG